MQPVLMRSCKGVSALPGTHLLENLKNVANDRKLPDVFAEL